MRKEQVILIADDSQMNREILAEMLGSDYTILEAGTGREAIEIMQKRADIDLVLLDIMMPEMDGFDVLRTMNQQNWTNEIPVIMISAESSLSYVEQAYDLGATDYISRPFDVSVVRRRVVNTLLLYAKQKRLTRLVAEQVYERERSSSLMINVLSHIVEFRNGESGTHVLNIRTLTERLLRQLVQKTDRYQLSQEEIARISTASALHDIGKINIPEQVLNKPGRLTPEEYELMKAHAAIGAEILGQILQKHESPLLQTAAQICRWHHERYDGRGYPDGLKGEEIPIAAQVVSLADVYDALTSERCYKKAFDHDTAIGMILRGECGAFQPLLLDCLLELESGQSCEERTDMDNWQSLSEAMQFSERLMCGGQPTYQDHMLYVLRAEQAKTDFFQSLQEVVQFEYDALTQTLTLSDWAVKHTKGEKSVYIPEEGRSFLDDADAARLREAILATTPEKPDTSIMAMFSVDGEYRWHKIFARSIWEPGEPPRYLGAVGQAIDIHERLLPRDASVTAVVFESVRETQELMRGLKRVFPIVRLVDVKNAKVLSQAAEGDLTQEDTACYALWKRDARCRDCISLRAFTEKTQLSRVENTDDGIYCVIAKYLEVAGRGCVLELVNRLQDAPASCSGQPMALPPIEDEEDEYVSGDIL